MKKQERAISYSIGLSCWVDLRLRRVSTSCGEQGFALKSEGMVRVGVHYGTSDGRFHLPRHEKTTGDRFEKKREGQRCCRPSASKAPKNDRSGTADAALNLFEAPDGFNHLTVAFGQGRDETVPGNQGLNGDVFAFGNG